MKRTLHFVIICLLVVFLIPQNVFAFPADPAEDHLSSVPAPFYGIWCSASKDRADVQAVADNLSQNGFSAQVLVTTDWDNLNPEFWYVVTAGSYTSEAAANADLSKVQALYSDAYVKYSGNYKGSTPSSETALPVYRTPFYGIWCSASKDKSDVQAVADKLLQYGFPAQVLVTTDWDNLNTEFWYVVTSGLYTSEDIANVDLPRVQALYPDAYIKYSGNYKGSSSVSSVSTPSASTRTPFYGIWCSASKSYEGMMEESAGLSQKGFASRVFVTTDWSNLNPEFWYVLTAGTYASEDAAYAALAQVQAVYPDAYVKYSGEYIGG